MEFYLFIGAVVIILMLLFQWGRKFVGGALSLTLKHLLPTLSGIFNAIMGAHLDLLKNLAPRDLIFKTLDDQKTSSLRSKHE